MPSSPELAATVTALPLAELGSVAVPSAAEPSRVAVFEIATSASVPAELLDRARSAAHAEGYAAGWATGMHAAASRAAAEAERVRAENDRALAEHRARLARSIQALDDAAAALERRAVPAIAEIESLILSSAFAIAEAVVGDVVADAERRAPATLARALDLAPAGEPVTVRLSADDHALLADVPVPAGREITLVADPQLECGDAVATSGATEIDARIRSGIARVAAALGVAS